MQILLKAYELTPVPCISPLIVWPELTTVNLNLHTHTHRVLLPHLPSPCPSWGSKEERGGLHQVWNIRGLLNTLTCQEKWVGRCTERIIHVNPEVGCESNEIEVSGMASKSDKEMACDLWLLKQDV